MNIYHVRWRSTTSDQHHSAFITSSTAKKAEDAVRRAYPEARAVRARLVGGA